MKLPRRTVTVLRDRFGTDTSPKHAPQHHKESASEPAAPHPHTFRAFPKHTHDAVRVQLLFLRCTRPCEKPHKWLHFCLSGSVELHSQFPYLLPFRSHSIERWAASRRRSVLDRVTTQNYHVAGSECGTLRDCVPLLARACPAPNSPYPWCATYSARSVERFGGMRWTAPSSPSRGCDPGQVARLASAGCQIVRLQFGGFQPDMSPGSACRLRVRSDFRARRCSTAAAAPPPAARLGTRWSTRSCQCEAGTSASPFAASAAPPRRGSGMGRPQDEPGRAGPPPGGTANSPAEPGLPRRCPHRPISPRSPSRRPPLPVPPKGRAHGGASASRAFWSPPTSDRRCRAA